MGHAFCWGGELGHLSFKLLRPVDGELTRRTDTEDDSSAVGAALILDCSYLIKDNTSIRCDERSLHTF
jgi:hypothetical protein